MSEQDSKGSPRLELFKAASTFLSSVVIAAASIAITLLINSREIDNTNARAKAELDSSNARARAELEISNRRAKSEELIARNRELTGLIPKLGSRDADVRKFSAVSLSLYGESAVNALIATLDDEDFDVQLTAAKALSLIGPLPAAEVRRAYEDRGNAPRLRGGALVALGMMRHRYAFELAVPALEDERDPRVRSGAAISLGYYRSNQANPRLVTVLGRIGQRDPEQAANILWALSEIGKPLEIPGELVDSLLRHRVEEVRYRTVWLLAEVGGEEARRALRVRLRDKSARVQNAARDALDWMSRKGVKCAEAQPC